MACTLRSTLGVAAVLVVAAALGCSSAQFGDSRTWKRPCGTAEQRSADRDACAVEASALSDPAGRTAEYTHDFFRTCMQKRGWQHVPAGTVLACDEPQ